MYNEKIEQLIKAALADGVLTEKEILDGEIETVDATSLITDFWDSNENLFEIVLYNHCKNFPDKLKIVNRVIKT